MAALKAAILHGADVCSGGWGMAFESL